MWTIFCSSGLKKYIYKSVGNVHKYITWYELNVLQRSMDFNAFETHFDSWYGTHKGPMNYDSSSIWMDWFGCLKLSHAQTIRSSLHAGPEEVGRVIGGTYPSPPDFGTAKSVTFSFKRPFLFPPLDCRTFQRLCLWCIPSSHLDFCIIKLWL